MGQLLRTIQKRGKLNQIYRNDEKGPGGAHHSYVVVRYGTNEVVGQIDFQNGPRNGENSTPGVIDSDLLEIVRDRLRAFQNGEYSNRYNAEALKSVETAIMWLNRRVEDRIERRILGTNNINQPGDAPAEVEAANPTGASNEVSQN